MQTVHNRVISRVHGARGGQVMVPQQFADLGSSKAIERALAWMVKEGTIQRIARGVYYSPKTHPELGILSPDPDKVAKAIAGKFASHLQPSGAYAANLLGLSTQVPAKIVYFTEGPTKTVRIGKQQIELKHTTSRNMATAGRISGLIIQAFRYLGKKAIDEGAIQHLRKSLKEEDKKRLVRDARYAPAWIAEHMLAIARET